MREVVRAFGHAAGEADVALIYFAGHGMEVGGENYLVPTDARLLRSADLEYEAVTMASVLNAASGARRLRVVILDACRNNPLGERVALRAGVTRSVTRGLARIEPAGDVLVAYSAKAGTLAEDGPGKHSPFAGALLEHMPTPGLDVRLMFGKVRDQVLITTRQRQEPYTYGSLTGDVVPLVPGTPLTKPQQVELLFWASVKDSTSPQILSTYLDHYPNGEFAPIARALVEHYERQLKLELAKREEERKLKEAEARAAEVKRLEDERRMREAALAEERRRAQEAKDAEAAKKLEEKQKSEALAIADSVQKVLKAEAAAREAAKLAEKNRIAALKEAEDATKLAEDAISKKREAENSPAKLAALLKPETPAPKSPWDGSWSGVWGSTSSAYVRIAGDRVVEYRWKDLPQPITHIRISGKTLTFGGSTYEIVMKLVRPGQASASYRGPRGEAIATLTKRDDAAETDPKKVAVLPKLVQPGGTSQFNGAWTFRWSGATNCAEPIGSVVIRIEGGKIGGGRSGSVSASGALRFSGRNSYGPYDFSGTLRGNSGSGIFDNVGCSGTFTARRN